MKFIEDYVRSFRLTMAPAMGLDESQINRIANRLATLTLRRGRNQSRLKHAWEMPTEGGRRTQAFYREMEIIGRYMTAIDNAVRSLEAELLGQ